MKQNFKHSHLNILARLYFYKSSSYYLTFDIRKQKLEADGTSSSSDVFHFNRFPHLSPGNHPTMTSDQLIDEQCPGRRL